jgi:hypothetical protein
LLYEPYNANPSCKENVSLFNYAITQVQQTWKKKIPSTPKHFEFIFGQQNLYTP